MINVQDILDSVYSHPPPHHYRQGVEQVPVLRLELCGHHHPQGQMRVEGRLLRRPHQVLGHFVVTEGIKKEPGHYIEIFLLHDE